MRDPGPFDGDFAEDGLEGEGSCPVARDAATALTVPPLEHQFVVGLLDEGADEPPLDLEAARWTHASIRSGRGSSWSGMGKVIRSPSSSVSV